jgi:hypothetical protein
LKTYLTATLSAFAFLSGCAGAPALTSGALEITQVDEYVFFQKLPQAVSLFGGVRTKTDEDRRTAVKAAAAYAKARGCKFIALASPASNPETLAESLRANKLRWNESSKWGSASVAHERAHMVKTPDERVFAIYAAPEKAFGSGSDGNGNIWVCLKERGENITRPELLVDPNEL